MQRLNLLFQWLKGCLFVSVKRWKILVLLLGLLSLVLFCLGYFYLSG